MQVKVFGFEWRFPEWITCAQFFEVAGPQMQGRIDKRMCVVGRKNEFWVGVLMSDKPGKSFCQKVTSGEKFEITPQHLGAGNAMVDLNHFVVYEPTGRGLYQYYHNSTRISHFNRFIADRLGELGPVFLDQRLSGIDPADQQAIRAVHALFEAEFSGAQIYKRESVEALIARMKHISLCELECLVISSGDDTFRAISQLAKREVHRFHFKMGGRFDELKARMCALLSQPEKFKKAKVHGLDEFGASAVYDLFQTPDCFHEQDHDDWSKMVGIDSTRLVESVTGSRIVEQLLELACSNSIKPLLTASAG